MALTQYTADTDIIETLGTNPEDRPTLTDNSFKAKFDENAANIKAFLNAMIAELLSNAAGKGASQIGIEDSGSKFTAATVEAALAEAATLISTHTADLITDANGAHGLAVEEGAWTPSIAGTTTPGTNTYATRQGKYYKIGKMVTAFFSIAMTAKGGTMAGIVTITGLPFTADNLDQSQGGSISTVGNIDIPTSYNALSLTIPASSNISYISIIGDNVVGDVLQVSGITATTIIRGVLQYKTA